VHLLWHSTVLGVNSTFVHNKSTAARLLTGRLFYWYAPQLRHRVCSDLRAGLTSRSAHTRRTSLSYTDGIRTRGLPPIGTRSILGTYRRGCCLSLTTRVSSACAVLPKATRVINSPALLPNATVSTGAMISAHPNTFSSSANGVTAAVCPMGLVPLDTPSSY
jgi:hypothetical protein